MSEEEKVEVTKQMAEEEQKEASATPANNSGVISKENGSTTVSSITPQTEIPATPKSPGPAP